MKTVGIIAEYNPFHSGHQYQIQKARELAGADFVVVVMSGDFVQRGEPAIFDKYTRTAMALEGGADLVLEMPVRFATSSAEDFAACGVALLDRLGVTDVLCFGSELGRLDVLEQAAEVLIAEPESFRQTLRQGLAAGLSFPRARQAALVRGMELHGQEGDSRFFREGVDAGREARYGSAKRLAPRTEHDGKNLPEILSSPNNILGIEYLKALKRRNSQIHPMTVRRQGQGYHDTRLLSGRFPAYNSIDFRDNWCPAGNSRSLENSQEDGDLFFPSASAIRKAYQDASGKEGSGPAPSLCPCHPLPAIPVFPDDLSPLLDARLLELSRQNQDLTSFADVSPELAARISRNLLEFDTFSGRIARLKTRQLTYTRISRALVHILLGITAEETALSRSLDYVPYIRILGFRKTAGKLLAAIRRQSALPMVTRIASFLRQTDDPHTLALLRQDLYASHLYQSLVFHKGGGRRKNEYTRSVVIRNL